MVWASRLLGTSYRQAKRVWARYQEEGDRGLVHRLRGRASNRHVQPIRKEQALELYRENADSRLREFRQAFGDLKQLDAEFVRQMAKVR